jgi:hypothetical protein
VRKTNEPKPLFKVGDWVSLQLPLGEALAQIIEDRGPIGVKGRRLYRLSVPRELNEPDMFELAEVALKPAAHLTPRKS